MWTYRHGALQSVSAVQQVSNQLLCDWKVRRQLCTSLQWIRIAAVQKLGTTEAILFPVFRCLGYFSNKASECLNYVEHQKFDCLSTTEQGFYRVFSIWLLSINLLELKAKMANRKARTFKSLARGTAALISLNHELDCLATAKALPNQQSG